MKLRFSFLVVWKVQDKGIFCILMRKNDFMKLLIFYGHDLLA